jgi:antirestriction protein ArdC
MSESVLSKDPKTLKGEERDNWLKAKQNEVMKMVDAFEDSPEDIAELITFMKQFHNYSFHNLMLIQSQWRGAIAVASYARWKKLGYPVKKGERGRILVWTYTPFRLIRLENGEDILWSQAPKEIREMARRGELKYRTVKKFGSGYVYDISQTEATEEDLPKIFPNRHFNFDIDEQAYYNMSVSLDIIAEKINTELFWDEEGTLGNAKGAYLPDKKYILLNKRNTPTEVISTALHELAHAYLHRNKPVSQLFTPEEYAIGELQAELTSALVCSVYGMNTLEKSVRYISNWIRSYKGRINVRLSDILQEVQKAVKLFTYIIDQQFETNSIGEDETAITSSTEVKSSNSSTKMKDIYCKECGESLFQHDQTLVKKYEKRLSQLTCSYCGSNNVDIMEIEEE